MTKKGKKFTIILARDTTSTIYQEYRIECANLDDAVSLIKNGMVEPMERWSEPSEVIYVESVNGEDPDDNNIVRKTCKKYFPQT